MGITWDNKLLNSIQVCLVLGDTFQKECDKSVNPEKISLNSKRSAIIILWGSQVWGKKIEQNRKLVFGDLRHFCTKEKLIFVI